MTNPDAPTPAQQRRAERDQYISALFGNVPEGCVCQDTSSPDFSYCMCLRQEQVARRYALHPTLPAPPLTPEQREWLAAEADYFGEGAYPRAQSLSLNDAELCGTLLSAWSDYVSGQI